MRTPLIIAYHAVSDAWSSPLVVSQAALAEQLAYYYHRNYRAFTFAKAEELRRAKALPAKSLVVTFDDAFHSVLQAVPVLRKFKWPATVFVVTEFPATGRLLEWHGLTDAQVEIREERRGLTWTDLRHLHELGWEVAAHTQTHALLTELSTHAALSEMIGSRDAIRRELGSCETMAYPYGIADARIASLAHQAGYLAACTLRAVQRSDEPMSRPRIRLDSTHTGPRLALVSSDVTRRLRTSAVAQLISDLKRPRNWYPTA